MISEGYARKLGVEFVGTFFATLLLMLVIFTTTEEEAVVGKQSAIAVGLTVACAGSLPGRSAARG